MSASSATEAPSAGRRSLRRLVRFVVAGVLLVAAGSFVKESCFVQVDPGETLVVQRFGAVERVVGAGLHWKWPEPIETARRVNTGQVLQMPIGFRLVDQLRGLQPRPEELQWLTGDTNIVELRAKVEFQVQDPERYLFQLTDSRDGGRGFLIRKLAESELTARIGRSDVDSMLGGGLGRLQRQVHDAMQALLDREETGLAVVSVQITHSDPPREVKDAFEEVSSAKVEAGRYTNEADGYARDLLPRTEGEAHALVVQARSDRLRRVEEARGMAQSFTALAARVREAPDVSRKRMWLDAVEQLFDRAVMEQLPTSEGAAYRLVRVRSRGDDGR